MEFLLAKDTIFCLEHIVSDLQNLDALLERAYEDLYFETFNFMSHFVDYSVFTFGIFMENKRYFGSINAN